MNRYIDELDVFPFEFEKMTLYEDEDFQAVCELSEEVVLLHLNYTHVSKSAFKRAKEVWETDVKKQLEDMGYLCVFTLTPAHLPIANRMETVFGFNLLKEEDGLKVFVHDLGEV